MEKELRKCQHMLVEAGTGIILFAVWNVAKVNLYLGLSLFPTELLHTAAVEAGVDEKSLAIFTATLVALVMIFQLSVRLYIGLSATGEGKGKNKSWIYLVLTAVLLITNIRADWQTFGVERILAGEKMSVELITGICMEAASLYVLLELLISGIRVKKLRKQMKV